MSEFCEHCGDVATCFYYDEEKNRRVFACEECYNEIVLGVIDPSPLHPIKPGSYGPSDDPSPGWENSVRALEEYEND